MPQLSPKGAGSHVPGGDNSIPSMVQMLSQVNPFAQSVFEFAQNTFNSSILEHSKLRQREPSLQVGRVIQAIPYLNWYKVSLDQGKAAIGCCASIDGGALPIGPRTTTMIPPGSRVLVYMPPTFNYAVIVRVLPSWMYDGGFYVPDWVGQDGASGFFRDDVYNGVLRVCRKFGNVINFNCGRPVDSLPLDWGVTTETGLALHMDPFQMYMRVNEVVGLFLSYFDNHARLAAWNFDLQTAVSQQITRDDEGELFEYRGCAVYPWETMGLLGPGQQLFEEGDDTETLYNSVKGKLDLPEGREDRQSFDRYREWGGYLGQGRKRMVVVPSSLEGDYRHSDEQAPDYGVFEEVLSLDGDYGVRSAHGMFFVKEPTLPVPQQLRLPEDGLGDDRRAANYRFSGLGEDGEEHKVGNLALPEDEQQAGLSAACLDDQLAYLFNWKGTHPFHYHTNDFKVPEAADMGAVGYIPPVPFQQLLEQSEIDPPPPVKLKVDHRYGEVEYFPNRAYIGITPQGAIVLSDGYGAELRLAGGKVMISAPGDIEIMSGRNLLAWSGKDISLRAKKSIDASTTEGDIHVKSEGNLQLLGGNGGGGGVLIETKATATDYDFADKVGEEVTSPGIILRSPYAPVVAWGSDVYLRTGGETLSGGNIVLDASRGESQIITRSATFLSYVNSFVAQYFVTGSLEDPEVSKANVFGSSATQLATGLILHGNTEIVSGDLVVGGHCILTRGGTFGSDSGDPPGKNTPEGKQLLRAAALEALEELDFQKRNAQSALETHVITAFYDPKRPGNETVIAQAGFSFRDKEDDSQYGTQNFRIEEPRWMQLDRFQGTSTGAGWTERPVTYQGRELYPFPGKNNFKGEHGRSPLMRLKSATLYDPAVGANKPRTDDAYAAGQLSNWERVALDNNFKTIF